MVKIPKNDTMLCKAVFDYEKYLHTIRETIFRAFMEQSGDHSLSENLTRKVFGEYTLPYINDK